MTSRTIINKLGQSMEIGSAVLMPQAHTNGYLRVQYKDRGKRVRLYVHRIIAEVFVPGKFAGASVDHIDGDRLNNLPSNLEWVTLRENTLRQYADGRGLPTGERHHLAKISDQTATDIKRWYADGVSMAEIARRVGLTPSTVHYRLKGRRRGHAQASHQAVSGKNERERLFQPLMNRG